MAVDPEQPFNREEAYLASAAGEDVEVPACPWSRKEAYLAEISGRLDGIDEKIAALSTDISLKGSVATEADLPSGAAIGDAYITEDTGVMYVWVGDDWVALGGTGINVVQSTGLSTTDVMSQKVTSALIHPIEMIGQTENLNTRTINIGDGVAPVNVHNVFVTGERSIHQNYNSSRDNVLIAPMVSSPNEQRCKQKWVAIGGNDSDLSNAVYANKSVNVGMNAYTGINNSIESTQPTEGAMALGFGAYAGPRGSIALGYKSRVEYDVSNQGIMSIGTTDTNYGYDNTNYRLLSGVHDGEDQHDAATVAQGNTLGNAAPTTATVGVVGQLYTDTSTNKLYHCTAVTAQGTTPETYTYTWEEVGGGGGAGGAIPLTSADYNYHLSSGTVDDTVGLWMLPTGIYESYTNGVKTAVWANQSYVANAVFIVRHPNENITSITAFVSNTDNSVVSIANYTGGVVDAMVETSSGTRLTRVASYANGSTCHLLNTIEVVDNLTNTRADVPLSANQGKVLKGLIDALDALITALGG